MVVVETKQVSDKQGSATRGSWLKDRAPGSSTVMVEEMGTRITVHGSAGQPFAHVFDSLFLPFSFLCPIVADPLEGIVHVFVQVKVSWPASLTISVCQRFHSNWCRTSTTLSRGA